MILLASLLLAQAAKGLLGTVIPHPTGENGYEEYLRAADLLQTPEAAIYASWQPGIQAPAGLDFDEKTGLPKESAPDPALVARYRRLNGMAPLEVRREELSKFGRVLDLIRAGNVKGGLDPRTDAGPDTLFPQFAAFKGVTRFAARAAGVYAADGHTDRATETLLDQMEFADNTARGPLIAGLVGVADTSIALAAFGELLPRLSRVDATRIVRATDALLARSPAARAALPAELAFVKGALRKAMANDDPKKWFLNSDGEPDGDSTMAAFAHELASLGRAGRTALMGRIETRAETRMAAMDRVMAGPESGWVSGIEALRLDEETRSDDLEGALSALLLPEADTFKGFAGVAARSRTQLRLLSLHARLIQYRWDFGHYPASIDVADPLTGGRFLYELRADGSVRLASKGLPSTGEIELKYKRPPTADVEPGTKP